MSNPEHAYQELAQIFASRGTQVLEIEIIPSSLGSFLHDGNAIGTSKKSLIAAYTVARQLFSQLQPDDLSPHAITEIMLLFDCEHLTACNWRKRRLNAVMEISPNPGLLQAELTLMSSYQCSPLHRHTKSPTLWHHRLWVLRHLLRMRSWSSEDLLDLQNSELDVVLRAGELHPKNYYAFSYMRQISVLLADRGVHWNESAIDRVVDWCLAHPRDISGWSFAVYALGLSKRQYQVQALERVVQFALSVAWEGESLWIFIAQTAQQFGLEDLLEAMLIPQDTSSRSIDHSQKQWQSWLDLARKSWAHSGRGSIADL